MHPWCPWWHTGRCWIEKQRCEDSELNDLGAPACKYEEILGTTQPTDVFAYNFLLVWSFCYSSVTKSCATLWDTMDCSIPGFSVLYNLPEFAQTHVPLSQWCHPTISSSVIPFSTYLQSCPASGSFLMSQPFTSGGQSIRASASVSVLPMNIQDWFPSGLTGLISLQSKGFSRVFSNTILQKH